MVKEERKNKNQNQEEQQQPPSPQQEIVQRLKSAFITNKKFTNQQCSVELKRCIFPNIKAGDVLEIKTEHKATQLSNLSLSSSFNSTTVQTDEYSTPILLQVVEESFKDENIQNDTIRITQAAASEPFNIKNMSYVLVKCVPKEVCRIE